MRPVTIAYFQNGLGNFICMTPALMALSTMDPSGKIDIALYSGWSDSRRDSVYKLAKSLPFVNAVISWPKRKLEADYKSWYYVNHSEHNQLMQIFRRRAEIKSYGFEQWRTALVHEIDYCIDHVYRRGYTGAIPPQTAPVADSPILAGERPFIGFCNGGFGHLRKQKVWPHFQSLAEMIKKNIGGTIIKLGYSSELSEVTAYDQDYVGKTDILETAKIISQLDCFVTTDTGNMHIGDALRVPMVALFGGSSVVKNGPINGMATILKSRVACQPCQGRPVFNDCNTTECMSKLSPETVFRTVKKICA